MHLSKGKYVYIESKNIHFANPIINNWRYFLLPLYSFILESKNEFS